MENESSNSELLPHWLYSCSCIAARHESITRCSAATPPAVESYRSLLEFTDFVRDGIASLEPADNIDVQSFMYVIGAPGYVRETVARRAEGA